MCDEHIELVGLLTESNEKLRKELKVADRALRNVCVNKCGCEEIETEDGCNNHAKKYDFDLSNPCPQCKVFYHTNLATKEIEGEEGG